MAREDETGSLSPVFKRRRPTRNVNRSPVDYNMKHHPMDATLRPKASQKRRIVRGAKAMGDERAELESSARDDLPQLRDTDDSIPSNQGRRRSSRVESLSKSRPMYSRRYHPMDDYVPQNGIKTVAKAHVGPSTNIEESLDDLYPANITREPANKATRRDKSTTASSFQKNKSRLAKDTIHPNRRRSLRASHTNTSPDYDMKFHPMDTTIRPTAAAKRGMSSLQSVSIPGPSPIQAKKKTPAASDIFYPINQEQSRSTSPSLLSGPLSGLLDGSSRTNPFVDGQPFNWDSLYDIDHCVYCLQKGAPIHGDTLPMEWANVMQVLLEKGHISIVECDSEKCAEQVKSRYESVRVGLELYFHSNSEPTDNKDWTLYYSEGLNAHDKKLGQRYWRHHEDRIVRPTTYRRKDAGFLEGRKSRLNRSTESHQVSEMNSDRHNKSHTQAEMIENEIGEASAGERDGNTEGPEIPEPRTEDAAALSRDSPALWGLEWMGTRRVFSENPASEGHFFLQASYDDAEDTALVNGERALLESMGVDTTPADSYPRDQAYPGDDITGLLLQDLEDQQKEPIVTTQNQVGTHLALGSAVRDDEDIEQAAQELLRAAGQGKMPEKTKSAEYSFNKLLDLAHPLPIFKSKKPKRGVKKDIRIHEDDPKDMFLHRAMNPVSPGTDVPTENLSSSQGRTRQLNGTSVSTPLARRARNTSNTPSNSRAFRGYSISVPGSHRNLFGGSPGTPGNSSPTS